MKCKKCGHDLLVRIEPKGLGNLLRLVPMAPYVCVKCGARRWRASDDWGRTGTRAALMGAVLAAMIWAIWHANSPGGPAGPVDPQAPVNVIRETIDATARAPELKEIPLDDAAAPALDAAEPKPLMVAQADAGADDARPVTTDSLRQNAREAEGQGLDEVSLPPGKTPQAPTGAAPEAASGTPGAAEPAPEAAEPDEGWLKPAPDRLVGEPVKASAGPGTITAIDFLPESDRLLITVAAGGPVENAEPHLWPPKFVVDIPGKWKWSGPSAIPVGRRGVVRIRTGADDKHFRIVLDMDPAPKTPPAVQSSPGGLLILVK